MRKFIKKLHLYTALVLFLPLVIQGLTGALLVFQHEISAKKYELSEGQRKPLAEIIEAARSQAPEGFKASSIRFDEAAIVRFSKRDGEKNMMREVVIDPVSLTVLEVKNPQEYWLNLIKRFHASLLIKGDLGKNIVGIYGFVLLFMTISGLIIWWPKPGNLKRALTFKFSSEGKKFHRDLHSAVGFWSLIFLFITSFSGIYLIYPKGTHAFVASIFPARDLREIPQIEPNSNAAKIDEIIAIAKSENELKSIMIPSKPNQPYRLNFASKNHRDGEPLIVVFVDQYKREIIEERNPSNYSLGEKILAWQHSLHEGSGFGLPYQIAVFLVGFLPLLFSITGIALWWIKRKSKKLSKA